MTTAVKYWKLTSLENIYENFTLENVQWKLIYLQCRHQHISQHQQYKRCNIQFNLKILKKHYFYVSDLHYFYYIKWKSFLMTGF